MSESSFATGVLLKQASDGDQRAWDELVRRFTNLLWSVGRAHRLDTADIADVVQTTWLRLLENLDRIADPERLVGWLVTTSRRECLRTLRRSGREQPHSPDEGALDGPDLTEPLDAGLIREERDAELWAAFGRMNDRCQRLLRVLMSIAPPPYEAVAAMLDMPVGSIGPTRMRCLHGLRKLLDESGDGPPGRQDPEERQ